jgi:Opioid growth factor receptor (OGFr) conserved region
MAPTMELTAFFEGTEGDYRGRKFSDILEWSDSELEASHDYIQTLFPLPEASLVNWSATIIDRKVFDAFRAQPELREKLRAALTRILSFYGFQWLENADHKKVRQTPPKSDESLAPLSSD